MATFFKRIHDLRVDNDLKQKDIASILKVNVNTYPHWESGMYEMPIEMIDKLSKFYNCSIDYLTGLSNVRGSFLKNLIVKICLLNLKDYVKKIVYHKLKLEINWGLVK